MPDPRPVQEERGARRLVDGTPHYCLPRGEIYINFLTAERLHVNPGSSGEVPSLIGWMDPSRFQSGCRLPTHPVPKVARDERTKAKITEQLG